MIHVFVAGQLPVKCAKPELLMRVISTGSLEWNLDFLQYFFALCVHNIIILC